MLEKNQKLNDPKIRKYLKKKVLHNHLANPDILVLDECGLRHGSAIIDILVISDNLEGFEIKSDVDSLHRLKNQSKIFSDTLDKMTLVVGQKLIEGAMKIIPDWWGVKLVTRETDGNIKFDTIKSSTLNFNVDILSAVKLLWKDEALDILKDVDPNHGVRWKPKKEIYLRLAEVLDEKDFKYRICTKIKSRQNWKFDSQHV